MDPLAFIRPEGSDLSLPDKPLRVLGIDLGTTNSTVAELIWEPGLSRSPLARCLEITQETTEGQYTHLLVPSVVAIHSDKVIVGEGAKRLRTRASEVGLEQNRNLFYECKNDIGSRKTYHRAKAGFTSAAQVAGRVLKFLSESALENDAAAVTRTVVTVPASFQAAQRNDTLLAAELADLDLEGGDLLDEPVAAFLDYLMSKGGIELGGVHSGKKLMVFDFGGGTCDVAVFSINASSKDAPINISPLAVSRYHRLGGGDIDRAILFDVLIPEMVRQNSLGEFELSFEDKKKYIEPALLSVAEALKISLCTEIARLKEFNKYDGADKKELTVKQPGRHVCTLKDRTLELRSPTLSAARFEELLVPFLDQDLLYARETEYRLTSSIFAPLEDALKRAGLDRSEIDYCLMVGGSSLIPQVRDEVEKFFAGGRLLTYDDRDSYQTSVARGAAYHALARALFGRGLIQPVTSDRISIRTASGEVSLIPKGAGLPFPPDGYARSNELAAPQDVVTGSLPLRVEVVAGDEQRLLLGETWNVTGPVGLGDPLALEYRLDENQVLDLKLWLAGSPELGEFSRTLENPLTNVVNPGKLRLEIEETEEKLRTREITATDIPRTLADLGSKYADLGQAEKALDYLKRALAGKGPDAGILNQMGLVAGELGDHEREEKFYREAASVSNWGGPWFNLALMKQRLGKVDEAIEAADRGIACGGQGPYVALRAQLAEKRGDQKERDRFLQEAIQAFSAISAQSDWELGWFLTAVRMSGDDEKVRLAQAEQARRVRGGTMEAKVRGVLPIQFRSDGEPDR